MRSRKIELVHGHMFTGAYYGVAAARVLGIKSVVTYHGGSEQTDHIRRRLVMRSTIRFCNATTVVSEQMRADIADALGPRYRGLTVIANGMPKYDGDRTIVRDELKLSSEDRLVVAVGSCCVRKNHVALVHALASLPTSVPWQLAICGRDDDATDEIKRAIRDHGVAGRVHLLGIRLDVGNVLAATDVYAMPSLWEGTPLALIEAMLVGKPCVASTAGGIPAMIDDGVHGLLVAAEDTAALARALETLVVNADGIADRLGRAAAERAAASYGLEAMCEQYQAIYDAVA